MPTHRISPLSSYTYYEVQFILFGRYLFSVYKTAAYKKIIVISHNVCCILYCLHIMLIIILLYNLTGIYDHLAPAANTNGPSSPGTHPTHVDPPKTTSATLFWHSLLQFWYFLSFFFCYFHFMFTTSLASWSGQYNLLFSSSRLRHTVSSLEDFFPEQRKNPKINWFCLHYSSLFTGEKKKPYIYRYITTYKPTHTPARSHTRAHTHTHALTRHPAWRDFTNIKILFSTACIFIIIVIIWHCIRCSRSSNSHRWEIMPNHLPFNVGTKHITNVYAYLVVGFSVRTKHVCIMYIIMCIYMYVCIYLLFGVMINWPKPGGGGCGAAAAVQRWRWQWSWDPTILSTHSLYYIILY